MVLEGPDFERNKMVRWRCADLQAEIASRWSVSVAERTLGKLLRRLRMTRLQPRQVELVQALHDRTLVHLNQIKSSDGRA